MENYDFDPEFSEYNPIFTELKLLKKPKAQREDEGFMAFLLEKLTEPVFIPCE